MKYIILLGLLVGCSQPIDDFYIKSFKCSTSLDISSLNKEMSRLELPPTREASLVLVKAKMYECLTNEYGTN